MITIDAPMNIVPTVLFNRLDVETKEVISQHAIVFETAESANIKAEEIRRNEYLDLVACTGARVCHY